MTIERMREIKQEYGLSNQELSRQTGLPVSTIQRIFAGTTESPRMNTLLSLEKVLRKYAEDAYSPQQASMGYVSSQARDHSPVQGVSPVLRETAPLPYSLDPPGKYTIADYYALPEERRVELIDGVFYDMAAPSVVHQTILGELHLQFRACADAHGDKCDVILSPCDVQLDMDDKTMLQPDLFVMCHEYDRKAKSIWGAPDLVVEILSPSSRSKDMLLKLNKYHAAHVREYWIVDPKKEKVYVFNFDDTDFEPEVYFFDSLIPIHISGGACEIDFARIHKRLQR